jgi:F-type H+-transporting ATPase subunit b
MPQLDVATFVPQLVWLAITFIALYWILSRSVLPRVGEILESRQDKIAHDLAAAEAARAEAEGALKAYEASLAKARAEAQVLHARALDDAAKEAAKRRAEQDAEIQRESEAAERDVAAAKTAAMGNVRSIAGGIAQAAVAKLIGVEVSQAAAEGAAKSEEQG